MSGPPENETSGTGVATGPDVKLEWTAISGSGADDTSTAPDAPAVSNVIPFRPFRRGEPHPFEIVEITRFDGYMIAAAGPIIPEPWPGRREPWRHVASFPRAEKEEAFARAQELAAELGVPFVDLTKLMTNAELLEASKRPQIDVAAAVKARSIFFDDDGPETAA